MDKQISLAVTTELYGNGEAQRTAPRYLVVAERTLTARALIAEYVHLELQQAAASGLRSLALSYLLADSPGRTPAPALSYDPEAEIGRAWAALAERRYMLLIDGAPVADLDAPLPMTERSRVSFIRLLPLIGG